MPKIFPFKAVRPSPGMELLVSASTHDTTIKGQLTSLEENPFTYLHVIKPHLHFNEEKNPDKHFPMAKSYLKQLISQKVLNQDEKPAFYIYRQTKSDQTSFTGIIATVSAHDYFEGHIKVHENTLTEKEAQLVEHIRITGVMGEPVLLTYRRQQSVDLLINEYTKDQAPIDFTDENLTSHEIWIIKDEAQVESLSLQFGKIDNFYIADGHHRSAAAAKYIKQYRENEGGYLSCLIPDNQLKIASFHRVITKMDNFDKIVFLEKLKVDFEVEISNEPVTPVSKYQFGLCLKGKWYILKYRYPEDLNGSLEKLNVSVLEEHVIKRLLNILDSKTDSRLKFVSGKTPLSKLEHDCKKDYLMAFTLMPCSIGEIYKVADEHKIMPPKSTYIEPKLRTGLIIQSFS